MPPRSHTVQGGMRLWGPMQRALVVGSLVVVALAGCAGAPPSDGFAVSHVHGVAYDASTGRVYLATHHGLARGEPGDGGWSWSYVGPRDDYMGFTQDTEAQGTFYTSGHPGDPQAFGGVHLGLRRSTDGGETWEQRSLKGQVDFHALSALHGEAGGLVGSWQGALKVSLDGGATWTDHQGPPVAVVALATGPGRVLAATPAGLWETRDTVTFTNWIRVPGPSQGMVSSVASSPDGATLLAGTGDGKSGGTFRSTDRGETWSRIDHATLRDAAGQVPFAFDRNDARHAFAALADGRLLESRDAGASWSSIR